MVGSIDSGAPGAIREVDIHLVSQLNVGMIPDTKKIQQSRHLHVKKYLASPSALRLLAVDLARLLDPAVEVLGLGPVRRDLGLEAGVLPQEGLAHVGGVPLGGGVAGALLCVTERHTL